MDEVVLEHEPVVLCDLYALDTDKRPTEGANDNEQERTKFDNAHDEEPALQGLIPLPIACQVPFRFLLWYKC